MGMSTITPIFSLLTQHKADSICINQDDLLEKGQQVSMMGQIYSKSQRTLICLGSTDGQYAQDAAEIIMDVNRMIRRVFERDDFKWDWKSFPYPEPNEPLVSHPSWKSVRKLTLRPWFSRVWTIQETAMAPGSHILWGDVHIDWTCFLRSEIWRYMRGAHVVAWAWELHVAWFYSHHPEEGNTLFSKKYISLEPKLLDILNQARSLHTTDSRDRIYAFLDLPHSGKKLPLAQPDYTIPYMSVYSQFARNYVEANEDLDILTYVQNNEEDLACSKFPSWVPRWDVDLYHGVFSQFSTYKPIVSPYSINTPPTILADDSLQVRGIHFDTIRCHSEKFGNVTIEDIAAIWDRFSLEDAELQSPYNTGPPVAFLTALQSTFYVGDAASFIENEKAYVRRLAPNHSRGHLSPLVPSTDLARYPGAGNADLFHSIIRDWIHNRKVFRTQRGYYGLGPGIVREGDICCVINGSMRTSILRPTSREAYYKIVGDASITSTFVNTVDGHFRGRRLPLEHPDAQDYLQWELPEEDIFLC